jgi:solute carrier family 10 (sodium/bile acid cotransporter), member 7
MSTTEGDEVMMMTSATTTTTKSTQRPPKAKDSSITDEDDVESANKQEKTVLQPFKSTNVEKNETVEEEVNTNTNDEASPEQSPSCSSRLWNIFNQYEFLILVVIGICLAKAYPPLGAIYLQPQITATWLAVMFIFCKY